MADAVPILLPMEKVTLLITRQEDNRNKIIKMTSEVEYSIAMYSLIITAYVGFQIYNNGHLNITDSFFMGPFFISLYLLLCGVEVVSRWLYAWNPFFYTQFGQSYLVFLISMTQVHNKASTNRIDRATILLLIWTIVVLFSHVEYKSRVEDDSLAPTPTRTSAKVLNHWYGSTAIFNAMFPAIISVHAKMGSDPDASTGLSLLVGLLGLKNMASNEPLLISVLVHFLLWMVSTYPDHHLRPYFDLLALLAGMASLYVELTTVIAGALMGAMVIVSTMVTFPYR